MNDRLKKFFSYTELSQQELSEKLNVSKATISHLVAGRNKPSVEMVQSLKTKFPEISLDWLIMNKGKMKIDDDSDNKPNIDIRIELDRIQHVAEQTNREIQFQLNEIKNKMK